MRTWRVLRTVLSFWLTPFRASTWRRFGYAIAALPINVVCLGLAVTGRAETAARYQHRLAGRLAGLPVGGLRYPVRSARLIVCSVLGLAISLASWVLLQDLAFLMLLNVAYPIRAYVSAGFHDNFLPWDGWNLLWSIRFHPASGPDPWADTYDTSWGGPTLVGAWTVHAGLSLVTIYPVLAWAIRGLTRLQGRLIQALLGGPAKAAPSNSSVGPRSAEDTVRPRVER
jgi:hypothetical protein